MLLCCITPSSSGKTNASSRCSKKDLWRRCRGGLRKSQHTKYPSQSLSLALHYLPFASRFPPPHFTLAILFALSFPISSSFSLCLLFACVLVCLLVVMAQYATKLCDFTNTNNNDFFSTPIAPLANTESCEINTTLLNLVMKDQFAGLPSEDAATHLNGFVDLCDMQKKKDVDNDVVKLKLFPFSLRDRAKAWFSSLPKNSIDSWNKCKDAFISKYFPPAKIISLRNDIMNFKQLDHEHVAQAWERMKLMLRNCPTHDLNLWMIIQNFYAGLNFASRNLLDSAPEGIPSFVHFHR